MTEAIPEPTDDTVLDGTQIPSHNENSSVSLGWAITEEGEAGVGDVFLDDEELNA